VKDWKLNKELGGMTQWEDSSEYDDESRSPRFQVRRRIMQFVVTLAIAALVLPGLLVTWTTQVRTAQYACQIATAYYAPGATGSDARFSLVPAPLAGWNCYAVMFDQSEFFVANLGVIPGAPRLRPLTGS
jgi:hypothetical protein